MAGLKQKGFTRQFCTHSVTVNRGCSVGPSKVALENLFNSKIPRKPLFLKKCNYEAC